MSMLAHQARWYPLIDQSLFKHLVCAANPCRNSVHLFQFLSWRALLPNMCFVSISYRARK